MPDFALPAWGARKLWLELPLLVIVLSQRGAWLSAQFFAFLSTLVQGAKSLGGLKKRERNADIDHASLHDVQRWFFDWSIS
jgi:hypothetical protein